MKLFDRKKFRTLIAAILLMTAPPAVLTAQTPPGPDSGTKQSETRNAINTALLSGPAALSGQVDPAAQQEPKITLELKGVDVLDVLKIISQRSDLNIVAGRNVHGVVSLYLKNVKIRDALDTIINTLDLAYVEENGIINVMTAKEYEDLYGRSFGKEYTTKAIQVLHAMPASVVQVVEKMKSPKGKTVFDERTHTLIVSDRSDNISAIEHAVQEFDHPLVTKVFRLQYAKAEDLEAQLHDYLTPQIGIIKVDKRTSQITVSDRAEKIDQIADVIKALDVRPRQVLIQAQVVEVTLFDAFRYGIDWEYVRSKLGAFHNIDLKPTLDLSVPAAAAGAGTLSTFTLGGLHGLSVVLSLLQNVGKTNTLSSPRITVINNEEAKLVDATRQPYVSQTVVQGQTTSQTADNVQFVDVGVTMTVVPSIVDDERVILKLKPEVSSQTGTLAVQSVSQGSETPFTRSAIPIVSSQTLETTVIVKTGETLVVGGLLKDNAAKIRRKLPVLGDIPFLGAAFRSEEVTFQKTELVIFLTPYVVSGDVTSQEHAKYVNKDEQLQEFDLVGGYDFGKALKHSQGIFRIDHDPYWAIRVPNRPKYFYPADLYERATPYEDRVNQFESFTEGKSVPDTESLLKNYQIAAAREVQRRLLPFMSAAGLTGEIEIVLRIAKDGSIRDLSWVDPGPVRREDQKREVLRIVRDSGPFAAFPQGLNSEEELMAVRLSLVAKPAVKEHGRE